MPKMPHKVPVTYIGQKNSQDDPVAGTGLTWTKGQTQFVTVPQAAMLLYYPTMWADGRTADDKKKFGPIQPAAPVDHRYAESTKEELEEGRDVMPLVDVTKLDAQGLVTFAGTYLGKRLDVADGKSKLLDQVQRGIEGQRFEWA